MASARASISTAAQAATSSPPSAAPAPAVNPQVAVATAFGARNTCRRSSRPTGPIREARFSYKPDGTRDGGVHALFVISGGSTVDGATPAAARSGRRTSTAQVARNNVVFRIPTPTFGAGLIEQIPDAAIPPTPAPTRAARPARHQRPPHRHLPTGNTNRNGNDGTITRFGWKAQNKSLLLFSGEAYNVEMGITNELFQSERDETPNCQFAPHAQRRHEHRRRRPRRGR